ncbi:MAG: hypothetical protein AVDCRST_MAG88-4281, partial [uncultured Thermomicrobiales bacterium]
ASWSPRPTMGREGDTPPPTRATGLDRAGRPPDRRRCGGRRGAWAHLL